MTKLEDLWRHLALTQAALEAHGGGHKCIGCEKCDALANLKAKYAWEYVDCSCGAQAGEPCRFANHHSRSDKACDRCGALRCAPNETICGPCAGNVESQRRWQKIPISKKAEKTVKEAFKDWPPVDSLLSVEQRLKRLEDEVFADRLAQSPMPAPKLSEAEFDSLRARFLPSNGKASKTEVEAVVMLAVRALGSEHFWWLDEGNDALGSKTPREMLQTSDGAKRVRELLLRIEKG